MPIAYQPGTQFDPANAASKLSEPFRWAGGAAGSLLQDLTGGKDPLLTTIMMLRQAASQPTPQGQQ